MAALFLASRGWINKVDCAALATPQACHEAAHHTCEWDGDACRFTFVMPPNAFLWALRVLAAAMMIISLAPSYLAGVCGFFLAACQCCQQSVRQQAAKDWGPGSPLQERVCRASAFFPHHRIYVGCCAPMLHPDDSAANTALNARLRPHRAALIFELIWVLGGLLPMIAANVVLHTLYRREWEAVDIVVVTVQAASLVRLSIEVVHHLRHHGHHAPAGEYQLVSQHEDADDDANSNNAMLITAQPAVQLADLDQA